MTGIDRLAWTLGGRLARMAVGFAGLLLAVGAFVPAPGPDGVSRWGPDDPIRPTDAVALSVPEGDLSRSLTITDESGRELATVTHFRAGSTLMVARRRGGPDAACWFDHRKDRAVLEWNGTDHSTRIDLNPDGTATSFVMPSPGLCVRGSLVEEALSGKPPRSPVFPLFLPGVICILAINAQNTDEGLGRFGDLWQSGCLNPLNGRVRDLDITQARSQNP